MVDNVEIIIVTYKVDNCIAVLMLYNVWHELAPQYIGPLNCVADFAWPPQRCTN